MHYAFLRICSEHYVFVKDYYIYYLLKNFVVSSCHLTVCCAHTTIMSISCVLCKLPIFGFGHNAEPLAQGKCCDACNVKVIQTRMTTTSKSKRTFVRLEESCGCWPPRGALSEQGTKAIAFNTTKGGRRTVVVTFPHRCNAKGKGTVTKDGWMKSGYCENGQCDCVLMDCMTHKR